MERNGTVHTYMYVYYLDDEPLHGTGARNSPAFDPG
jgi:hypothetical protein